MDYTQSISIEQTQSGYTLTVESLINEQPKTKNKPMKYLFYIFAFFAVPAMAQDYSYQLTQDSTGLFTLDQIETFSDTRQQINRTANIDSASLQGQQYSRIESAYNQIAAYESRIFAARRSINALKSSLSSVGLNNYNADQFAKYDSTFVTNRAIWSTTQTGRIECFVQYREGLTQVIRRVEDNAVIGTILPLSANYILVNIAEEFRVEGVARVQFSAIDNRTFWAQDPNNVFYRFTVVR